MSAIFDPKSRSTSEVAGPDDKATVDESAVLDKISHILGYDVREIGAGVTWASADYEQKVLTTPDVVAGFEQANTLIEEWKRKL